MQPLASAVDILQSELKRFMGVLISAIICLKRKLPEVRLSAKLVIPLIDAFLQASGLVLITFCGVIILFW